MSENVTFGIKLNVDDKGVGQATINVKELANVVNKVKESASKNPFKEWLTDLVGFEALTGALQRISGAVHELTDLYAAQEVAEARLSQVMQNTMGATEAKDIILAQRRNEFFNNDLPYIAHQARLLGISAEEILKELKKE